MAKYLLSGFTIMLLLACLKNVGATDTERGKLLYENHCMSCHESVVHIRENRRASSLAGL